jgi:uncharacterized RDD family membrane protein YckC
METTENLRIVAHPVGVGPRAVAAFIDALLSGLVLGVPLTIALGERHRETLTDDTGTTVSYTWSGDNKVFFLWLLLTLGYFIFFEAYVGATVGKLILNLRVRQEDGTPIGLEAALTRNVCRLVDAFPYFLPYLAGAIAIWGDPRRRRLGDRAAGTIVTFR